MLDLRKLHVSLTKHGAHKIALILQLYPKNEVLDHLSDSGLDIDIDPVQARKNLSVGRDGEVPQLWDDVRALGTPAINALVLLAIIFSHEDLIRVTAEGAAGRFRGRIPLGPPLQRKEFSNLKHTFEELGFSTDSDKTQVSYDLAPIFAAPELRPLIANLLALKLRAAGWDGSTALVDELIANGFHRSLAVSEAEFRAWLESGDTAAASEGLQDTDFFTGTDEIGLTRPFQFRAGHTPKKTGVVGVTGRSEDSAAVLRHNEIQTALHEHLVKRYGKDCVGTENGTGNGTSIDVVVKTRKFCWFYEIKVAKSARACIRQAIPQLLEYAYWRCDARTADKLVILSELPITNDAAAYLGFLRKRFKLPLHYEQFSLQGNDSQRKGPSRKRKRP